MPRSLDVVSHWHHSVENLTTSATEFYDAVSNALTQKTAPVHIERIEWPEAGVLSAKRTYLRLTYNRFTFDICAFPFGKDYYFSWWMGRQLPGNVLLYGCGLLIGSLVAWAICIKIAGAVAGSLLFLVVAGAVLAISQANAGAGNSFLEDVVLSIPVLGRLYERFFRPVTYYSEDGRLMFEETVHRVVMEILAGVLAVNQMPALTADERRTTVKKKTV